MVGLLGVAYGAGLLMNHSEVPKSTTVLGVDIGGGTKEDAVSKLDTAIGERAFTPLQLTVGGKKEQLAPDKAGLSLDSQATVRNAAGSDYNPVSVISSLFGGERVAEPVILVDEEKLSVALTDLAGVSGSATEGTITFEPGKAVAVPGKSGQALDVARSMLSVKDAYRAQVETGRPNIVELPLATRGPSISQVELDRAMKEFAEPAMSGLVTIKAGAKQIKFGPARSLPKILSMKAIDGKLVEVYNKKAIDELLEGVFDGVMITKGDGKKHQVSADDVAQAMGPALRGATPRSAPARSSSTRADSAQPELTRRAVGALGEGSRPVQGGALTALSLGRDSRPVSRLRQGSGRTSVPVSWPRHDICHPLVRSPGTDGRAPPAATVEP